MQANQPSRVGRQRPPGASKSRASTRTRVYDPNVPDVVSAHKASPYQYVTNASLRLDGRDLLAPFASLPPCRRTSRGRSRGVGATCTAPTTHGRPKRSAWWAQNAARSARHERSVVAVPSDGVSRLAATGRSGFREQIDGLGWLRAPLHRHSRSARRGACSAGGGRQAPIFRQESEGGIRRRMRRQPGGESGWRCCLGMEPSGRAAGTHGARFEGSHHALGTADAAKWVKRAEALFDAAARDDQHKHKYFDRSLRGTSRGSSRAASGGPPSFEVEGEGGTRRASF